jgi:hypothetical protein
MGRGRGTTYRGVPGTEFIWYNEWADPDILFEGETYNYWDVEDGLWQLYCEDCREARIVPDEDEGFQHWIDSHHDLVISQLLDCQTRLWENRCYNLGITYDQMKELESKGLDFNWIMGEVKGEKIDDYGYELCACPRCGSICDASIYDCNYEDLDAPDSFCPKCRFPDVLRHGTELTFENFREHKDAVLSCYGVGARPSKNKAKKAPAKRTAAKKTATRRRR